MKKRFSEEHIIGLGGGADATWRSGTVSSAGFSESSYYVWHKVGGMSVSDAKRLRELERKNKVVG